MPVRSPIGEGTLRSHALDGGATWHTVEGREAWRYEWKPEGSGTRTIPCRAVDDSGNLEAPAADATVSVSEEA